MNTSLILRCLALLPNKTILLVSLLQINQRARRCILRMAHDRLLSLLVNSMGFQSVHKMLKEAIMSKTEKNIFTSYRSSDPYAGEVQGVRTIRSNPGPGSTRSSANSLLSSCTLTPVRNGGVGRKRERMRDFIAG